ncbi:MAG: redox-sensing transcriptional repressor Rex [Candidatus Latescibacterota bacterium]|jgi:redox-sensing transcriptional repressor
MATVDWKSPAPPKTISRLSLYRRLLTEHPPTEQTDRVYSHGLARMAGVSAAQVRRDIMLLGCSGTPNTGYDVRVLIDHIAQHIDAPEGQQVALVGIGNLGRAILTYFSHGRKTRLKVIAAFDIAPEKTDRVLHGCRCYPVEQMAEVIRREHVTVGINAVPAEAAQQTADALVAAGVTGILNFAPIPIQVPSRVYVGNMDITVELETAAFFALNGNPKAGR